MSAVITLLATCVAFAVNVHASYSRDVWMPGSPARSVAEQLDGLSCAFFGLGANCSNDGVRDAFEGSSFQRVSPTLKMFDDWYHQNMRPVLAAINEPVQNLRAKVAEELLAEATRSVDPSDVVALEKETSLQRQFCESRGGSRLYCQIKNPLPWDASSTLLEARLSCPANTSSPRDYFSVPVSTREAAVLYLPLIDQELDDVMQIANLTRVLLPVFQENHRRFKTVRFQRFVAADGVALIYPAVASRHVKSAYGGGLSDLRDSPSFTHSSCARQVVFVLDVSSKSMHFDVQHRSEALIIRIFRLLNHYDQVQLIFTASKSSKMTLGRGSGFVAADARAYSELQMQLSRVLRSGYLFLDSGISLAQDLLRAPSQLSCLKKFLIVLSSDEASLLPATISRHVALRGSRDAAGSLMQPYFIFISMDSLGYGKLSERFCSHKMKYQSIPPMNPATYKGHDSSSLASDFVSDAAFGVMRYCTAIFELFVVNGVGPSSASDVNKVVWTPPFHDAAAAPGSLVITTSIPVYTTGTGAPRFRGTVEVDHVFYTILSLRNSRVSQSDGSVVSILNKVPEFLGAKVGVVLTALGAGMNFVDPSFLMKLNALSVPLQRQLSNIKCGNVGKTPEIFAEFNSTRASATLALRLQWADINSIEQRTFAEGIMSSSQESGYLPVKSLGSSDSQSIFFRHSESTSLAFLRKLPSFAAELAVPTATSTSKNCSSSSSSCRSLTDGLLFMSNASAQAGFVLSPTAFTCPQCARDSYFSESRSAAFGGIQQYAAGKSDLLADSDLSMLPSAVAELNILASLKTKLLQASATQTEVSAASVTGMNGVSFVVNRAADPLLKSSVLSDFSDFSQNDWFTDAANDPGVLHVSRDPASDATDPATLALILSVGVAARPQGLLWTSGAVQTKALAAVAHLRVRSSWLIAALTTALLRQDPRHMCMSAAGICAMIDSRGYIVASIASNRSTFRHVSTMYPFLADALLYHKVFTETWTRRFIFSEASDFTVRVDNDMASAWTLNKTGPSRFQIFAADSLYSVGIAKLSGVACVLVIVLPHHSLNSNVRDLERPRLLASQPLEPFERPALSPRLIANATEIEDHAAVLSVIMQQRHGSCNEGDPPWLLGVSIGSGMAVLFLVTVVALNRFGVFQMAVSYFFQHKASIVPVAGPVKAVDDLHRFQFKLCSPNDFPVQKSILRCVSVFHNAFETLENQIITLNTTSLSKDRIIADDIDGQRIKIQNYMEVLKKQRTLLHERIVSRMCASPCTSSYIASLLRFHSCAGCSARHCVCGQLHTQTSLQCWRKMLPNLRFGALCSALALAPTMQQVVAKNIELVRDQLQERCDALN